MRTSVVLLMVATAFFVSAAYYRVSADFGGLAYDNYPPVGPMPEGYAKDRSPEVRGFRFVCSQCHDLPSPRMFDPPAWRGVLAKMGQQMLDRSVQIPQRQIDLAVAYVMKHARPAGGAPPLPTGSPTLPSLPNLSGVEPQIVEAIEASHRALATNLENPEAWGDLAMTYHAHNLFKEAVECYRWAEVLDREDHRWPHLIGTVLEGGLNGATAAEHFQRAVDLQPDDTFALVRLGTLSADAGDDERAEAHYRAALKADADCVAALLPLGELYGRTGNDEAAMRCLQKALQLAPRSALVHGALAVLYGKQADGARRAARHARAAARLPYEVPLYDPTLLEVADRAVSLRAHRARAGQLAASGQHEEAVEVLQKAVALRPDDAAVRVQLGQVLRKAGQLANARQSFEQATALDPSQARGYLGLARIDALDGEMDRAVEAVDRAIELEPNLSQPHFVKAQILDRLGRDAEALASLEVAHSLHPDNPLVHRQQGAVLLKLGRDEEAVEVFRKAIEFGPGSASGFKGLGVALLRLGRDAEAVEALRNAVRLGPDDPVANVNLILALRANGQRADAERGIRAGIRRWPQDLRFRQLEAGLTVSPQFR